MYYFISHCSVLFFLNFINYVMVILSIAIAFRFCSSTVIPTFVLVLFLELEPGFTASLSFVVLLASFVCLKDVL